CALPICSCVRFSQDLLSNVGFHLGDPQAGQLIQFPLFHQNAFSEIIVARTAREVKTFFVLLAFTFTECQISFIQNLGLQHLGTIDILWWLKLIRNLTGWVYEDRAYKRFFAVKDRVCWAKLCGSCRR